MSGHQKAAAKAVAGSRQPESPPRMHNTHFLEHPGTCPSCGSQFQPRRPWQRFCSVRCRSVAHKQGSPGSLQQRVQELERRLELVEGLLNAGADSGIGNG